MNHRFFMEAALKEAEKALSAGEFPVGCVVVCHDRVIVTGSRRGSRGDIANETDHAEMVALRRLTPLLASLELKDAALYTTLEPCLMCFGATVLSGIGKLVFAYEDVMGGATNCPIKQLNPLYRNASIQVVRDVLRDESLSLFKTFFTNPQNQYWRNSLLADYTLKQ